MGASSLRAALAAWQSMVQLTWERWIVSLRFASLAMAMPPPGSAFLQMQLPCSRHLLKEPLAKHHETLAAKDATEGLDLYVANAPDIVFLDIELPDLNGYQVLQRILKLDPKAFVVMTTANNIASDVKKAIAEGAKGYVVKPFTRQRIEQYIELYKAKFRQG